MKSLSSQRSEIHNGGNRVRYRRRIAGASSKQDASVNFEDNENSDPVVDQTPSTQDEVVIDLSTAIAKEAGMGGPPASPACRLQKMAKTAYHGLKKKQLQEKCRQCGLSTRGDDKQLKARHQEFVTLYNAECDSFHPRSKEQLIQLVQEREKARKVRMICGLFCKRFGPFVVPGQGDELGFSSFYRACLKIVSNKQPGRTKSRKPCSTVLQITPST